MKVIHLVALVFTIFFSACGKDFANEIQELRSLYEQQGELIKQLQKGVSISSYKEDDNGYTLTFTDGKIVSLKNAQAPIIKIGDNKNWFINGTDTGISSQGKDGANGVDGSDGTNGQDGKDGASGSDGADGTNGKDGANGKDGQTPTVEVRNGVWVINGLPTDIKAIGVDGTNGANGKDAPYIVSSVITDGAITFNFSDGSKIESKLAAKRFVVSWGDSLTSGGGTQNSYTAVLSRLVGTDKFDFLNFGVGGENSMAVAARQGGIPMYLGVDVQLPADETPVTFGTRQMSNILSTWNEAAIYPMLQTPVASNTSINDCTINGVSVVLKWTGKSSSDQSGTYTLQRSAKSDKATTLKAGSILYTASMRNHRNAYANIFWVGQNAGSPSEDLAAQYKAMVSFTNSNNYLIIGLTTGTADQRKNLERVMTKEFGARYVNLRAYMSTEGIYDAGITPTQADLDAMEKGSVPPSLLVDAVHFNNTGYKVIGEYLYKKFTYLGVF